MYKKRLTKKRKNLYLSDDDEDEDDNYNSSQKNRNADETRRQASRRKTAAVSYKETTDEQTASDELIDTEKMDFIPVPDDKCEIIEKILDSRFARISGKLFIQTIL